MISTNADESFIESNVSGLVLFLFSSISWWTLNVAAAVVAPTIREVINEVNNNNRNKISWNSIWLIIFVSCQHCQTRTKRRKSRNSVLGFWLSVAAARSDLLICWKGYPCDNLFIIYFFIFKNTMQFSFGRRRSLALYSLQSTCVFISSEQIHWFLSW